MFSEGLKPLKEVDKIIYSFKLRCYKKNNYIGRKYTKVLILKQKTINMEINIDR
jgi:hypothetical protein